MHRSYQNIFLVCENLLVNKLLFDSDLPDGVTIISNNMLIQLLLSVVKNMKGEYTRKQRL